MASLETANLIEAIGCEDICAVIDFIDAGDLRCVESRSVNDDIHTVTPNA